MKKVSVHLSAAQQDDLAAIPGDTDSEKLHWLVNYWGKVLDQHRARKVAERKPAMLAALSAVGKDVADEPQPVETARVITLVGG